MNFKETKERLIASEAMREHWHRLSQDMMKEITTLKKQNSMLFQLNKEYVQEIERLKKCVAFKKFIDDDKELIDRQYQMIEKQRVQIEKLNIIIKQHKILVKQ